ncbi:MAG TPA: Gfo/Idh/MocA family oxidoreductase [Puia sp.]|nr:Gfo/Idh/MocA family oxidoreductase [Puia sp.]
MLKNHLLVAFRNITRNKAFSFINIVGLGLGMACSLLIFLWVQDERDVDRAVPGGASAYTVYENLVSDGKPAPGYWTPGLLALELKRSVPDIQYATGFWNRESENSLFEAGEKNISYPGTCYADSDFFKIFNYPLLQGTAFSALASSDDIAISRKMAESFFGSAQAAFGKPIRRNNGAVFKVSAVFDNLPEGTSQRFDYVLNWKYLKTFLKVVCKGKRLFCNLAEITGLMMKKINWGIIGCGDVTELKSGPAFNKVADSALVAVMRRDAAKAEDYALRHGVPRWYADANQLINDPEVNAIYIATPPSSHEEYTLAAINAGKHVYVEKPMANNFAAASHMADVAVANNSKLVVAHYRREQPRFKKIKELIRDKAIGEVLLVRLELSKPPLTKEEMADPKIDWRVNPAIAGGGLFHDLAPHQLDLMYYFFGPVEKVTGIATNQGGLYTADDLVAGNILFRSGVAFSGTWCFNAAGVSKNDFCEIIGTAGKISFNVFSGDTITLLVDGQINTLAFDALQHVQQPMIEATVRYFLDEGPNPDSGREGAEVMRIMERFVGA